MTAPASETFVAGLEIPGTDKVVYQRALERSTFSDDSSHNDDNARKFGYPGALVSAYVLSGLMSEPLVSFFGAAWFTGGSLALTFVGKGVQQGDRVAIRGTITGVEPGDDGTLVTADISMTKGDIVVVVGQARCLMPAR
jgi:hypothetical protein